jgi:glycosyltransferase involved in cell wall biosynthesis
MSSAAPSDPAAYDRHLSLSVVVPVYNEVDNVRPLVEEVVRELDKIDGSYEVILVNDGSTDGTAAALDEAAAAHRQVKVIHFAANAGQTLAIRAGLEAATGRRVVLMDGDRQNDPSDIAALLDRLDQGFACVSGWRRERRDTGLRRWPSVLANHLVQRVTGVAIHDLGCTLKAYRADALDPTELFGEMHRFLPILAAARGGRIDEMVVKHHPRRAGVSKYGLNRTARVIADLLLIRTLLQYPSRPSHLLARIAQYMIAASLVLILAAIVNRWVIGFAHLLAIWFVPTVVLVVGAICVLSVGLACELVVRNRYAFPGRRPYRVLRTVNFDESPTERTASTEPAAGAR